MQSVYTSALASFKAARISVAADLAQCDMEIARLEKLIAAPPGLPKDAGVIRESMKTTTFVTKPERRSTHRARGAAKPATKKPVQSATAAAPAPATPPPAKKPMSAARKRALSISAKKRWARESERKKMSATQSARWAAKHAGEKRSAHAGHRAAR